MDGTPSLSSVSDDGSYDLSAGPLTPNTSPLFRPTDTGFIFSKQQTQLLTDVAVGEHEPLGNREQEWVCFRTPPREIKTICFIGAGYVGGPTAAVIALHNLSLQVNVLDRDESRIQRWKSAHLPIHEPGLDEVVRTARDGAVCDNIEESSQGTSPRSPNLNFTTDSKACLSQADMIFLAVNTPTKTFGCGTGRATNMNAVDDAVRDIGKYAKDGVIIVEKSTVPCGTAKRISSSLRSLRPDISFEVLSNPEFLSEGCAIDNLLRPDRILIGSAQTPSGIAAASALAGLYTAWVPGSRIVTVNTWSSELSKLVANAMLAQRISSINSISAICEATGADVNEISRSIGLDPRIGPKFLKAGLGFGGSCFRKDIASLTYLAESLGLEEVAEYWHQVNAMNELQRRRFTSKVIQQLDENLTGKKIALLGFAFKKDTGDTRESLAVDVINQLLQERPAEVSIFDPYCAEEDIHREFETISPQPAKGAYGNVRVYPNVYGACNGADAILIITDCDQFKCEDTPAPAKMATSLQAKPDKLLSPNSPSLGLLPRPQCAKECKDCEGSVARHESSQERVDWRVIADGMRQPRWVFDGRCLLNVDKMAELGFQVRAIGKRSW